MIYSLRPSGWNFRDAAKTLSFLHPVLYDSGVFSARTHARAQRSRSSAARARLVRGKERSLRSRPIKYGDSLFGGTATCTVGAAPASPCRTLWFIGVGIGSGQSR